MMKTIVLAAILFPTVMAVVEEACMGKTTVSTKLDFFNAKVSENKLHDGGVLRYEGIGQVRGKDVDLVVSVSSGSQYSTTKPHKNGKDGSFGNINMMTLKDNKKYNGEGTFDFCFRDSKTNKLTVVDSFRWSFYDVDERGGQSNGIKEMIVMDTEQVEDFILYPNSKDSEIKLVCEKSGKTPTAKNPCAPGERTQFKSSTGGVGSDNPNDPNKLTERQKKRSVLYTFKNKSCFTVELRHYCPVKTCRWYGGGNFLFAGDAQELIEEGECITKAPEPAAAPTSPPTSKPTTKPTQVPTAPPTSKPTVRLTKPPTATESSEGKELCLGKTKVSTELDLFHSKVTENDLQNGGVLKYEGVGKVRDRNVDLVVSVVPGTTYKTAQNSNGKTGEGTFGKIGLFTVKGDLDSGKGNFRFCFHDSETGERTKVDSFRWSVFDIDSRHHADNGIKEKLIVDTNQADDFMLYPNKKDSEVKLSCEDSGLPPPCAPGERTVFHSSTRGVGADNPDDPNKLTEQQKKRSVVFAFKDTDCWDITYNHYCRIEAEKGGKCRWYGGGFFLFSGDAKEIIEEGECLTPPPTPVPVTSSPTGRPTDAPTMTPTSEPTEQPTAVPTAIPSGSPTEAPTVSPTSPPTNVPTTSPTNEPTSEPTGVPTSSPTGSPTEEPTVSPTSAPTVVPTSSPTKEPTSEPSAQTTEFITKGAEESTESYECPGDIQLTKIDGVTPFETSAVRIVSQDTQSVTVQVSNTWKSSETFVDSIFYEYKKSLFDTVCFEETNVGSGQVADTFTIACNVMTPVAFLKLCMVDDLQHECLSADDTGTIPACCHADIPSESAVVCYNLQIACQSTCDEEVVQARARNLRGTLR